MAIFASLPIPKGATTLKKTPAKTLTASRWRGESRREPFVPVYASQPPSSTICECRRRVLAFSAAVQSSDLLR
jgi:hypothetical protein